MDILRQSWITFLYFRKNTHNLRKFKIILKERKQKKSKIWLGDNIL